MSFSSENQFISSHNSLLPLIQCYNLLLPAFYCFTHNLSLIQTLAQEECMLRFIHLIHNIRYWLCTQCEHIVLPKNNVCMIRTIQFVWWEEEGVYMCVSFGTQIFHCPDIRMWRSPNNITCLKKTFMGFLGFNVWCMKVLINYS